MIVPVKLAPQKPLPSPLMNGCLANFELRSEFRAGKQATRAQSLESARKAVCRPSQCDLPRSKCLMLPVGMPEFIESRSDLLIGTGLQKLIDDRHDSRLCLANKCHRFGFVDFE